MSLTKSFVTGLALAAAAASPALAEWQWVDEAPTRTETYTYEERQAPNYYEQQPQTYYREEHFAAEPVVTNREVFWDGRCEVTRTYFSDGTSNDDRLCERTRLMLPHHFIIDRLGRHFDHLRGYDRPAHF